MQSVEHELSKQTEQIDIADVQLARDFIREQIDGGVYPMMTVPAKFADYIKNGLQPRASWISEPILAGTLVRRPYLPDDEPRVILKIKVDPARVQPRFTGPDRHYHGVVVFNGPINPEEIEIIDFGQLN